MSAVDAAIEALLGMGLSANLIDGRDSTRLLVTPPVGPAIEIDCVEPRSLFVSIGEDWLLEYDISRPQDRHDFRELLNAVFNGGVNELSSSSFAVLQQRSLRLDDATVARRTTWRRGWTKS